MAKGLAKEIESERERLQDRVEEDFVPTPSRDRSRSKSIPVSLSQLGIGFNLFSDFSYGP